MTARSGEVAVAGLTLGVVAVAEEGGFVSALDRGNWGRRRAGRPIPQR
jgi:hypothetical protein